MLLICGHNSVGRTLLRTLRSVRVPYAFDTEELIDNASESGRSDRLNRACRNAVTACGTVIVDYISHWGIPL